MSENQISPPGVMTQAAMPTEAQINMQTLQDRLAEYVAAMAPGKPVDEATGAQHQTNLWTLIKFVLARKGSEFVSLYSELLKIILANRTGVFHESKAYRFFATLRMSVKERRNFERMMNLLLNTCDPRTRHLAFKQVDLQATMREFADNDTQQRIAGFYTL